MTNRLADISLADKNLHPALQPLTPFKNRLALIQGLSSRIAIAGHSTNHPCLGAYPSNRGAMGQTIDHALAQALPSVFNHVALGMTGRGSLNYSLSASGRGQTTPIICTPELGFRTLFGSVADATAQRDFDQRSNLLDFMADDVRRSRAALTGEERLHLDNYLNAFESLHQRQGRIAGMREQLRRHAPNLGNRLTTETTSLILEAQFETGAAALIAGLTNVLLLSSGGGEQNFGSFPEFGIPGAQQIRALAETTEIVGRHAVRYGLVLVLLWIGAMKFTAYEAEGISLFVANSPLMSWAYSLFSIQGFSTLLGATEIGVALLIAFRPISLRAALLGSAAAVGMFATTLSFLLTTPGVWEASAGGFPALSVVPGQFLAKDFVLLGAALSLFGQDWRALTATGSQDE